MLYVKQDNLKVSKISFYGFWKTINELRQKDHNKFENHGVESSELIFKDPGLKIFLLRKKKLKFLYILFCLLIKNNMNSLSNL